MSWMKGNAWVYWTMVVACMLTLYFGFLATGWPPYGWGWWGLLTAHFLACWVIRELVYPGDEEDQ